MASIDFVQYLRDRNLVNDEVARKIREGCVKARIPLGRLLLEAGAMSMRDVMKVLSLQGETPGIRFGEIATRLGMVDTMQLERALRRQATARKHQIEIVREQGVFNDVELQGLVMDYVSFLELRAGEDMAQAA